MSENFQSNVKKRENNELLQIDSVYLLEKNEKKEKGKQKTENKLFESMYSLDYILRNIY